MGASYPRSCIMRTSAIVLLAVAFVNCDSDPYTIGQVAYGAGYGGVVTGIDYGHGLVAGYRAIGNRGFYGKREADSNAYTIGQVAAGLPIHNAYATGHPHNVGVITGVGYGYQVVTMESVKLNLTPLDRLLQVCPFTMPSLLDIPTMLVLLLVMDMDTTDKLVL